HRVARRQLHLQRSHDGRAGRSTPRGLRPARPRHGGQPPTATRGILDAGSKALTTDPLRATRGILDTSSKALTTAPLRAEGAAGYGYIVEYPEATIYDLSEEHGHVDFSACPWPPALGERVRIIANHACTVSNLFDEAY